MLQTVQGYFQEGQFVSPQQSAIPDYVEVYVVITDKAVPSNNKKAREQRLAFEEFIQGLENAEPLGDEFDEAISQGIHFRRELDL